MSAVCSYWAEMAISISNAPCKPRNAPTMATSFTSPRPNPSLTDASIPTPPSHIFIVPPFPLTGNSFFGGQTFGGFVARNIFVNTPAVGLNPLNVNLNPYGGLNSFDFVAVQDFYLEGSVTFNGLSSLADLSLIDRKSV